jgi:predicted amidohydrolase YtcJ
LNIFLFVKINHETRHDLDQASAAHPILVTRTCGHIAVANSLALHLAGIDATTPARPAA